MAGREITSAKIVAAVSIPPVVIFLALLCEASLLLLSLT
jgi:hypothetical protein